MQVVSCELYNSVHNGCSAWTDYSLRLWNCTCASVYRHYSSNHTSLRDTENHLYLHNHVGCVWSKERNNACYWTIWNLCYSGLVFAFLKKRIHHLPYHPLLSISRVYPMLWLQSTGCGLFTQIGHCYNTLLAVTVNTSEHVSNFFNAEFTYHWSKLCVSCWKNEWSCTVRTVCWCMEVSTCVVTVYHMHLELMQDWLTYSMTV